MMMFVLMAALLIAMVTLGVMRMVAGDVSEGFGGLEAVQAFNIAEAGAHYAMGQLQGAGASTYTGETLTVTNGSVTLGTAAITVNCIDTGTAPPCSGTYASYRRIVSTSTLPMSGLSGGPTRTIVAIVQALSGSAPFGLCATTSSPAPGYYGVMIGGSGEGGGSVFTDVASNSTVYVSGSGLVLRADASSPQKYHGNITSVGAVTCTSGCGTQVQGTVAAGASPAPCAAPTPPTFQSGGSALSVPCTGATIDATTSPKYSNISWTAIATPAAPTVTAVGASGLTNYSYKVAARDITCNRPTVASSSTSIANRPTPLNGTAYNHITWTAVAGASSYDVFRGGSYIGNTSSTSMNDTGQGTSSYNGCSTPKDLTINTGASGTNSFVDVTGTFTMGYCSRVIIGGSGNLELRFGQVSGQVLTMAPSTHFGMLPSDTMTTAAPVPANRLIVNVNSNALSFFTPAVSLASNPGGSEGSGGGSFASAGTFNVPNGLVSIGGSGGEDGGYGWAAGFFGSVNANLIYIGGTFHSDTSGSSGGTYSNFTNLRSWKDQ